MRRTRTAPIDGGMDACRAEQDRELVRAYLLWRRDRGDDAATVLGEKPIVAWTFINIWVGTIDLAHVEQLGDYRPGPVASHVLAVLQAFYDGLANAGARTAGDLFTALELCAAVPVPPPRTA